VTGKQKKTIRFFVFLIVGVFILYLVFRKTDFETMLDGLYHANILWIVLAMTVGLFSHWIRASRWRIMIESLGYNGSTYKGFLSVISGYFVNLGVPRAGEITRCALMSSVTEVPVEKLIGTVVTERIIDLIMTVLIVFLVLFVQFDQLYGFAYELAFEPLLNKLAIWSSSWIFYTAIAVFVAFSIWVGIKLFGKKAKSKRKLGKFAKIQEGFADGIKSVFALNKPWLYLFYTFAIWFCYFLTTFLVFKAFGFTSHESPAVALAVLLFSTLGVIVPAPGNVGAVYAIQNGMMEVYKYGENEATLFASVLFFGQVALFVVFGILSFLQLSILKRRQNGTSEE
jgi:glycosyltransferase 2 family protein